MGISDVIAGFINEMLEKEEGCAELQRCDLAQRFQCVPSQINYVISTRFPPERGYIVESRRGGGGYIRIRRVRPDCDDLIMYTINAVGERVDAATARVLIANLKSAGALDDRSATLIAAATGDCALKPLSAWQRNQVRASILKHMLLYFE